MYIEECGCEATKLVDHMADHLADHKALKSPVDGENPEQYTR